VVVMSPCFKCTSCVSSWNLVVDTLCSFFFTCSIEKHPCLSKQWTMAKFFYML
jgi:hypothetical protein